MNKQIQVMGFHCLNNFDLKKGINRKGVKNQVCKANKRRKKSQNKEIVRIYLDS